MVRTTSPIGPFWWAKIEEHQPPSRRRRVDLSHAGRFEPASPLRARSANLPTGQRRDGRISRPDTQPHLTALPRPDQNPLASTAVSTHGATPTVGRYDIVLVQTQPAFHSAVRRARSLLVTCVGYSIYMGMVCGVACSHVLPAVWQMRTRTRGSNAGWHGE